jgi:uncharacterized protein (DUF697 family)
MTEPSPEVRTVIRKTSIVGFGLGVVLSPIPLADEILLLPVYAWMTAKIGAQHGLSLRKIAWRPITSTVVAGLAARAAINVTVSFVPGVAAVANAVSAAALTQLLGHYVDGACADPAGAKAMNMSSFVDELKRRVSRTPPAPVAQ